ncbi:ATP-dependent helicase, partial [Streptomyces sp. SID6137]|nr:ATP-dependent helicase [Streptomyces sp. SID6137]
GGGAQGGEVGRRIALVRRLEGEGLREAGVGLGEQVEGGGRGRGVPEHGVHIARRAGRGGGGAGQ